MRTPLAVIVPVEGEQLVGSFFDFLPVLLLCFGARVLVVFEPRATSCQDLDNTW